MNPSPPVVGSAHHTDCRYLVDAPKPGPWNMAVDEALLIDAADNGVATLRFYGWSEPTLSLGYFQRYSDRCQHLASHECAVVRRQTGGGAILHDRELTYSISLPPSHPLARQNQQLYSKVHETFIAILTPQVGEQAPNVSLMVRCDCSGQAADAEPFLCFQRRSSGDVVLVPSDRAAKPPGANPKDLTNWKVLGSAQRRHHGAVLQHGSLLLERSSLAPELAGLNDLTGISPTTAELARTLKAPLADALNLRFVDLPWSAEMQLNVEELANQKYGADSWTKRR